MYHVVRKMRRLKSRSFAHLNVKKKTFFKKNQNISYFLFFFHQSKERSVLTLICGKKSLVSHPPITITITTSPHIPRASLLLTSSSPQSTPIHPPSLHLPAHSRSSSVSPLRPCTPPPHSNRIVKIPFDGESVQEVGFEPRGGRWRGGAKGMARGMWGLLGGGGGIWDDMGSERLGGICVWGLGSS